MKARLTVILSIILICLASVSFAGLSKLEDGLISAWTFDDGSAKDSVGSNHGKFKNGAKTAGGGKAGKALMLDNPTNPATGKNTGQYVEIPSSASLEQADGIFSISFWANIKEGGGRNHSGIFFKGLKIGWGEHFMVRIATTSATNLTWGSCWEGAEGWFATDNTYKEGEWFHGSYVVDGKTATAYVTSSVTKGTVVPASGQDNPKPIELPLLTFPDKPIEIGVGRQQGGVEGQDFWIDGMVDEIYMWNRALTLSEVKSLAAGKTVTAVDARGKTTTTWANIKSF